MTDKNYSLTDISKIKVKFPNAGAYSEDDPRLEEEVKLLREELSVPGEIRAACIHEVGHLSYFRLLGASLNIEPEKFCFVGPSVTYGLNTKNEHQFDHFIAATSVPFREDDLEYTDELLPMLANACFAGGVFVRKLAKRSLRGDEDDRKKFHRYYDSAIKQIGQPKLLESQLRRRAMRELIIVLQNETFCDRALAKASQLETEYFS